MNYFICGAHASGKTSLINKLSKEIKFDLIGEEIGKRLFYDRGLITSKQGQNFEFEVTDLEIQRDNKIFYHNLKNTIVESWHVGNLAYALVRNESCCSDLVLRIKEQSKMIKTSVGIWLNVSKENIFNRTKTFENNRQWAAEFYSSINDNIPEAIELLELENVIMINADCEFNDLYSNVLDLIIING